MLNNQLWAVISRATGVDMIVDLYPQLLIDGDAR